MHLLVSNHIDSSVSDSLSFLEAGDKRVQQRADQVFRLCVMHRRPQTVTKAQKTTSTVLRECSLSSWDVLSQRVQVSMCLIYRSVGKVDHHNNVSPVGELLVWRNPGDGSSSSSKQELSSCQKASQKGQKLLDDPGCRGTTKDRHSLNGLCSCRAELGCGVKIGCRARRP